MSTVFLALQTNEDTRPIIEAILLVRLPYHLSVVTQAAARAALADAHRRVEERHSQEEADRTDRLARQARELTDRGHAA